MNKDDDVLCVRCPALEAEIERLRKEVLRCKTKNEELSRRLNAMLYERLPHY
jgi:hypothetical protein